MIRRELASANPKNGTSLLTKKGIVLLPQLVTTEATLTRWVKTSLCRAAGGCAALAS